LAGFVGGALVLALGLAAEALGALAVLACARLVDLGRLGGLLGTQPAGLHLLAVAARLGLEARAVLGAAGPLARDDARGRVGERGEYDDGDDDDDDGFHGLPTSRDSSAIRRPRPGPAPCGHFLRPGTLARCRSVRAGAAAAGAAAATGAA